MPLAEDSWRLHRGKYLSRADTTSRTLSMTRRRVNLNLRFAVHRDRSRITCVIILKRYVRTLLPNELIDALVDEARNRPRRAYEINDRFTREREGGSRPEDGQSTVTK